MGEKPVTYEQAEQIIDLLQQLNIGMIVTFLVFAFLIILSMSRR